MTNRILCAVDLTHVDDARAVLAEAGKLAGWHGATLSVITVIPDYNSSFVGSFFEDGTLKAAAQAADKALHELVASTLPDRDQVQHIVEIGSVYDRVLATVETIDADMVIVGAHKPEFTDRVLGPNAARIVRYAQVSVLVLRL